MQTDQYMRTLGVGNALFWRQVTIVISRQYSLYMGKAYGFQGDQMRDLQHDLFFTEIVYADTAGIVSSVPGIYGDYSDVYRLAYAPRAKQAHYQKPKAKRAHRLTDHHSVFIIQRH